MSADPVSTFKELVDKQTTLRVPHFQRQYTWLDDEWDALWNDIHSIHTDGQGVSVSNRHFTGALLLMKGDAPKGTYVVDGQQRITTLTIIVVAIRNICKRLREDSDYFSDHARGGREDVVLETGPLMKANYLLRAGSKRRLKLTDYDDARFQEQVFDEHDVSIQTNRSSFRGKKALRWFLDSITSDLRDQSSVEKIVHYLRDLAIRVEEGIQFTPIMVDDDSEAYEVFESLNSKGTALSAADLLKNRLISEVADNKEHKTKVISDWNRLMETLHPPDGNPSRFDAVDFIFFYWRGMHETDSPNKTSAKKLYKTIKQSLHERSINALDLVESLLRVAPVFHKWTNADNTFPIRLDPDKQKMAMSEINMLRYRSCYPLFIYTHHNRPGILTWLARNVANFLFREITVNRSRSSVAESTLDACTQLVKEGRDKNDYELEQDLAAKLNGVLNGIDDESFHTRLRGGQYTDNKVGKYVHSKVWAHQTPGLSLNPDVQLEHILPVKPKAHWSSFKVAQMAADGRMDTFDRNEDGRATDWDYIVGDFTYRLGNMCLLLAADNRAANNKAIGDKLPHYKNSSISTTRALGKAIENANSVWAMANIEARCGNLADSALEIWPKASATPNP